MDLYKYYPKEYFDLFKYSPTFTVFYGVFALLPDWIGLTLWNLLNSIILSISIYYLPKLSNSQKGLVLIICLIEMMTSIQNEQSNALITGILILSFCLLEKRNYFFATFFLMFSVFIKLFGIVGFALLLFYPQKKKLVLYSVIWAILLFLIPLIIIDVNQYKLLASSFWNMISNDHAKFYGYSVMGLLNSWFGFSGNKFIIVI